MMTSISNASFIYTPYLFMSTDKPRYTIAMSAMAAFSVGTALLAWVMRIVLMRQNKRLAQDPTAVTTYPY